MEAVPRLPMISFELKVSTENVSFGPKLKQYIASFYSEDPESYNTEISNLEALRNAAVRPTIDVAGCQLLKKYYCQLHFLKSRFPMGEGQAAALYFQWKDVYSNLPCAAADINLELMCILHNIGALHSKLGTSDTRTSPEGMKMACTHFQCAAWAFQTIKENYYQMVHNTTSIEVIHFMQQVCLAQAQECILEKSMLDNRKATIIAKVAVQVVDYYKRSLNVLQSGGEETVLADILGSKTFKEWVKYLSFKVSYHKCIALLFQGQQAEEQQKMGERVSFYQAACEQLEEARKLSSSLKQQKEISEALGFTTDVVEGKRKAAKNENEFIYHEEVPDRHALQEVKGASLVKGIPFNVNDLEVSGTDIFARLVPMEAHEASSLYSEKKAQMLRQLGELVETKDQSLAEFMSSLQLDVFNQMRQATGLPQELVDRAAALSAKPTATQELVQAMSKLSNSFHEVDSMLNEIQDILKEEEQSEKEYQELMGKRPPSIIATDLSREASKYREAHNKANDSNQNLHKAMTTHVANLKILATPLLELQKQIPSVDMANPNIDESSIKEVETLISKVEEMRNQRAMLWSQFREAVHQDDITGALVTRQPDQSLDQLFQKELQKHQQLVSLIEQNSTAQENILKAFVDVYARSTDTRRYLQDIINKRNTTVTALIQSYDSYEDLLAKANKGIEFYNKLEANVSKLLQRIKSACKVQQEEREQMLMKNSVPRGDIPSVVPSVVAKEAAAAATAVNNAPKLKDYLDTRKKVAKPYGENKLQPQTQYPYVPGLGQAQIPDSQAWPPAVRPNPVGSEFNNDVSLCRTSTEPNNRITYDQPGLQNPQNHSYPTQPNVIYPYEQYPRDSMQSGSKSGNVARQQQYSGYGYGTTADQALADRLTGLKIGSTVPQDANSPAFTKSGDSGVAATTAHSYYAQQYSYNVPSSYPTTSYGYTQPAPANVVNPPESGSAISATKAFTNTTDTYQTISSATQNTQYPICSSAGGGAATNVSTGYYAGQYANYSSGESSNSYAQTSSYGGQTSGYYPPTYQQTSQTNIGQNYSYPATYKPEDYATSGWVQPADSSNLNISQSSTAVVAEAKPSSTNISGYNVMNTAGQVSQITQGVGVQVQYSSPQAYEGTVAGQQYEQPQVSQYPTQSHTFDASIQQQHQSQSLQHPTTSHTAQTYGSAIVSQHEQYSATQVPQQQQQQQQPITLQHPGYHSASQGYDLNNQQSMQQYPTPQTVDATTPQHYSSTPQAYDPTIMQQPSEQYSSTSGAYSAYNQSDYNAYYANYYAAANQPNVPATSSYSTNVTGTSYAYNTDPSNVVTPTTPSTPVLQPQPISHTPVIPVTTKESNLDLLSGLDFSVNQAPLIPQVSATKTPGAKIVQQKSGPNTPKTSVSFVGSDEKPATEKVVEKVIHWKSFTNPEVTRLFAQEIDKYEKFVEVLSNKTLSGPTNLDLKWKEIQDKQDCDGQKRVISVARCYPMKNRFPDILPYDCARVELKTAKDDYISASHIKDISYYSPPFIVTQAPLQSTFADFWTMIREQQVELITCLLSDSEIQNDVYWPRVKGKDLHLGDTVVSLVSETVKPYWTERLISVGVPEKRDSRVVMHLQFTAWPGSLFPTSPEALVSFVLEICTFYQQQRSIAHPGVVHCLSGIGRSGLVCLLITAIMEATNNAVSMPDLLSLTLKFNASRKNILRDREHLKFAYESFLFHMKRVVKQNETKKILNEIVSTKRDEKVVPPVAAPATASTEPKIETNKDPLSSLDPFWASKKDH